MITYLLLSVILVLLVFILNVMLRVSRNSQQQALSEIKFSIEYLSKSVEILSQNMRVELGDNRRESNQQGNLLREDLRKSIKDLADLQRDQLTGLMTALERFRVLVDTNAKENRMEVRDSLKMFKDDFSKSVNHFSSSQQENFMALMGKQSEQNKTTSDKLDQMRATIEQRLSALQEGNERKLDAMRETVDEKLQKTLESRLGESFKQVSERLEAVHKGLGDMQQLASGVGDLKKVLTNVKTRGVLGEYQLENLLDQMLTIDQYGRNVKTKSGSNALVEFAVKLPGRSDKQNPVWLPIDSKFPKEDFELLTDSYDSGNHEIIEEHRKNFVRGIRKCAMDICDKYIDPPNTTDFAILFLPFESLYAEVLRTPGLFESIQRDYRIVITGPTTLSALLNSLQLGFKTLAIEKRSSEVWELLGAVKTEFGSLGGILDKTQKKLQEASNVIEQAGVRSRVIARKLRGVQELPQDRANLLLEGSLGLSDDEPSAVEA